MCINKHHIYHYIFTHLTDCAVIMDHLIYHFDASIFDYETFIIR